MTSSGSCALFRSVRRSPQMMRRSPAPCEEGDHISSPLLAAFPKTGHSRSLDISRADGTGCQMSLCSRLGAVSLLRVERTRHRVNAFPFSRDSGEKYLVDRGWLCNLPAPPTFQSGLGIIWALLKRQPISNEVGCDEAASLTERGGPVTSSWLGVNVLECEPSALRSCVSQYGNSSAGRGVLGIGTGGGHTRQGARKWSSTQYAVPHSRTVPYYQ